MFPWCSGQDCLIPSIYTHHGIESTRPKTHKKTTTIGLCFMASFIFNSIHPVWSESSLSAWRKLGSLANHWAHSEDSDQTGQMPRLTWVSAGRTVILLVLSWRSSLIYCLQHKQVKIWGPCHKNDMSLITTKPVFKVCEQVRHKPACTTTESTYRLEISDTELEVLYYLGRKQQTKALIRLGGCAGWSVPFLFTNGKKQIFSWHGLYVVSEASNVQSAGLPKPCYWLMW